MLVVIKRLDCVLMLPHPVLCQGGKKTHSRSSNRAPVTLLRQECSFTILAGDTMLFFSLSRSHLTMLHVDVKYLEEAFVAMSGESLYRTNTAVSWDVIFNVASHNDENLSVVQNRER